MHEPTIVDRMAKFIDDHAKEHGHYPGSIAITKFQLLELSHAAQMPLTEDTDYKFWGVPLLIIEKQESYGTPSLQSH